jgi:hypothetical protein
VLVDGWVAGAAVAALLQLLRVARFQCRLARGRPAPVALVAVVAEVAKQLGVRPPPVVVVAGLDSPMVWGLGRARLAWPAALLGQLTPDSERAAVVHELAHLRRRDHWVGWLELVAGCVWWWSPLFWHVRRQIGCAAELACDAWVIETLPRSRRAYAEALLAVCELVSRRAVPAPALGMGGARQEIERRLTMILRESVPSRAPVRSLFGVVLLALIALPGFTDGQAPPGPNLGGNPPVASDLPTIAFQGGAPAAVDERELRLQKLENNLEALLKEVKELRAAPGNKALTPPLRTAAPSVNSPKEGSSVPATPYSDAAGNYYRALSRLHAQGMAPAPDQPINLTRATYSLSKEKADALAALLKDLKAPVLETQVKPDGIIVTTTPDAQRVVGDFVGLLQGRVPHATQKPMQAK